MKPFPMKIALLVLAAISLLAVLPTSPYASDLASSANIYLYPKPFRVADLTLKNPAGRSVSLADYRGRVVLLHFWSITCPACRMEEPLLEWVKRTFGPAGVEVLGVNLVDPPAQVASHAASHRLPFPVLFDGGLGFDLKSVTMSGKRTAFVINPAKEAILEVPGLPTTYILNGQGQAVGYSVGPAQWNHGSAQALLQRLIADKGAGVRPAPAKHAGRLQ